MAKTYYGGQAVIEGVMMKGKQIYATAVRTPEGDIAVEKCQNETILGRYKIFFISYIQRNVSFSGFNDNRHKNSYAPRYIGGGGRN